MCIPKQLEELLIQKIVETMTMRSEIGLLREQARVSERNQELTRMKLQQLAKQVKDFEMVLNRNAADRRTNPEKVVTPIKINRSVGLQVNFMTVHILARNLPGGFEAEVVLFFRIIRLRSCD